MPGSSEAKPEREPRWKRFAFGKPRIVDGVLWFALSVGVALYGALRETPGVAPFVAAAAFSAIGTMVLIVAVRDKRRRRARDE
ncbi:hypothetical protein [Leifsonia sp. 2MCAF36]|uniref:hypothetical protein n=1 Tax=Leifsonia sp. 2MCAF36 TaxID=3232988 RepID=UPI003F98A557